MVPMGHDFDYVEGATMTNLLGVEEKLIFEGRADDAHIYNSLMPLSISQDWTLALDYQFLMDSATSFGASNEFVLASCYQNANSSIQGFKLSLVHNANSNASEQAIQISWGNTTQTIDYANVNTTASLDDRYYFRSYRNMVVLTHNADNPNALIVYYTPPLETNSNAPKGADYGDGVQSITLTWSNAQNINVPLILGGNYNGTTTNIESNNIRRPAQAVVYWAKFWNVDLGERNCSELAAWPHETVPFYLSGYNGTSGAVEQIYADTELSFVAAQGVGMRYLYSTKNWGGTDPEDNYAGWHASR